MACSHQAIWLRRCAVYRRLVTTICDQDFIEHFSSAAGRPAFSFGTGRPVL
jgi:hypothetical protein